MPPTARRPPKHPVASKMIAMTAAKLMKDSIFAITFNQAMREV